MSVHHLPLTDLTAALRDGSLSSRALVDAHIARIEQVNPALNALVADRFDLARAEADAADALRARVGADTLPPLHGLPCTVKEFIDVAGLPCTGGLKRQSDRVPAHDAPVVARLKAAGAIVLGVSNAPEGGLWMETYNRTYGWTRNPHATARTPGGSSGGEGALVAAGASPLGLGSDVGGSVRIPAALCGVVGHKPTGGLLPNTGHHSPPQGDASRYLSIGPLVRRVGDVMPVLRALAGPDPGDAGSLAWPLGDPANTDIAGLTVWRLPEYPLAASSPAVRAALDAVADGLQARGAVVRELDEPEVRLAFPLWSAMLGHGFEGRYADVLSAGTGLSYPVEWVRLLARRSDFTFPGLTLSMLSDLLGALPGPVEREVARGLALRARLEDRLGECGVLLGPSFPVTAPLHRGLLARPLSHSTTCLWNVLELPATSVPAGRDGAGLPIGAQVIGPRGADARCLAVAAAIEADQPTFSAVDPSEERARDLFLAGLRRRVPLPGRRWAR